MPPLPVLSDRATIRAFESAGWKRVRQRGSHVILIKPGHRATRSIPDHKALAAGTLRSLIRGADMTVEDFLTILG